MRTVTYDESEKQLLPVKLTDEMLTAALMLCPDIWLSDLQPLYDAIRSAAPDHPATAGDADDAARPEWMTCESRRPFVVNSLRNCAQEMRASEKRCRNAYRKDFMGVPTRYIADAYGEAALAFETRLTAIDAAMRASKGGE